MSRHYSEEDVERGLQALALWQGARNAAAKALKEAGHPIPATTLRDWMRQHPERYERAREAVREKVWAEMGEEWQAHARRSIRAAGSFVDRSEELLAEGKTSEAATAARAAQSLSVGGGIGTDKVGVAQQRPAVPREEQSLPELVHRLSKFSALFPGLKDSPLYQTAIDSTAVEEPAE